MPIFFDFRDFVWEFDALKRYEALLRDTWWAWLVILVFGLVLGILLHPLFFSAVPIGIFSFFYFAMMRYDEDGNARDGLG